MRLLILVLLVGGCTRANPVFGAGDTERGETGPSTGDPSGTPSTTASMSEGGSLEGTASTTRADSTGTSGSEGTLTAVDTLEPPRDCCNKHGEPGCDEPDVEACVCTELPGCCEVGWHELCVEKARACGGGCGMSATSETGTSTDAANTDGGSSEESSTTLGISPCCEIGKDPGCNTDDDLTACVCEHDPDCCKVTWADVCVDIATQSCGLAC